jgi:hypothetical protein
MVCRPAGGRLLDGQAERANPVPLPPDECREREAHVRLDSDVRAAALGLQRLPDVGERLHDGGERAGVGEPPVGVNEPSPVE